MKQLIIPILLLMVLAGVACKKKSDPLPTTMTFGLNKDTLWTTTDVTTDNQNAGTVYISAKSSDGSKSMDIALSGYTGGKKIFYVDYRGPGGNINGNTGLYRDGSYSIMARTGKITITEVTGPIMKGTFDLTYNRDNFTGSFTAPSK